MKPAPRALAAQLWALAHDGPQTKGLDDLLHLAGSGRTSIPVDKEIDAALYRAAGYRVCGERAVRVDILERLADLIRPALAWREGAPGQKPPGAVSGGGFTIVNTMTSLTGASGEDFASILRSLGYRLERRPKPAEPVEPAPVEAVAPQAEIASSADETAPAVEAHEEIVADADVADPATEASLAPPEAEHAADEAQSAPEVATELAPTEVPAETPAMPAITAEDVASATGSASTVVNSVLTPAEPAAAGAAEPEMIEVWRPGRAEGRARPIASIASAAGISGAATGPKALRPRRRRRVWPPPRRRAMERRRSRAPTKLHARTPASRNASRAIVAVEASKDLAASSNSTGRAGTATGRRRTRPGTSGKTGVPNAGRRRLIRIRLSPSSLRSRPSLRPMPRSAASV